MMRFWRCKNLLSCLLLPISGLYRVGMALRRSLYLHHFRKITYFPVPVIVVGNITVGGTGKTPLVIQLANQLRLEGWKPGIVSRGYGGKENHIPQAVSANSDPELVGDEAVLIARKTACPMIIGCDRVAAVRALLRENPCDIVLSDDGLQHLALGRDIEIAVIDAERRFGNGHCLPAGPLREPKKRLKSVDFIVNNGSSAEGGWRMDLVIDKIYQISNPEQCLTVSDIQTPNWHAVAAIGNPSRFFRLLKTLGFQGKTHAFPDHYYFRPQDLDFGAGALTIMTEKDAVKCQKFADQHHWCLSVKAELPIDFFAILRKKILGIEQARHSHAGISAQS